ncbi:uncharacterized protein LOC118190577 [Stegodyphus dumicola]|uniref:uncharacterized protein LOC118190577 n=1 Tax=Stegodyphus dumicola TaxID=202533 RepID=UPI0015B122AA|nr:uncharacterized protein LOC118190577 [Stegodyphus dumicola]
MSSPFILAVILHFFYQVTWATVFPDVSHRPPIPGQAVRTFDISGQRYYVQDDLQQNPPQTMIKEEGFLQPDPKPDNQRWFIRENQSDETVDYPSSTEAFDRYYSNGLPAVGPVATPLPDEAFMIPTSSRNQMPDAPSSTGNSDIWVLTKGSDNQYLPQRLVQVPLPTERVVEVINQETSPKFVSESVKSIPFIPSSLSSQKNQFPPPPPANVVQEIWIQSPNKIQIQNQKTAAVIDELPSIKQTIDTQQPVKQTLSVPQTVKQIVDIPQPIKQTVDVPQTFKQIVQPQITKDMYQSPPPPPLPVLSKTAAPLPLPSSFKTSDITSPKQIIAPATAGDVIPDDAKYILGKNAVVSQVKHIWIPTSPQTGKFITVPVSGSPALENSGSMKGIPVDIASPVDVSETWILKQDGLIPRFEPQTSALPAAVAPSGKVLIDQTPTVVQTDSLKNVQLVGKSITDSIPVNMWPVSKGISDQTIIGKSETPLPPPPGISQKSDTIIVDKGLPVPPIFPPKTYINNENLLPTPNLPPLPPLPLIRKVMNDKPCPLNPQISSFPLKGIAAPVVSKTLPVVKSQPIMRIIRINNYPYGSYVLNSQIKPNAYGYSRPATILLRQTNNGFIRLIPANPSSTPVAIRRRIIPIQGSKSPASIIYPPAQVVSRLRYNYPISGYVRSFPVPGKNVFPPPQAIFPKAGSILSASSGSRSSSESSSSESSEAKEAKRTKSKGAKSAEAEGKKVEEAESIETEEPAAGSSSSETKPQKDSSSVEKESERETEEEVPAETQSAESIEVAESQFISYYEKHPEGEITDESKLKLLPQKYTLDYDQRDSVLFKIVKKTLMVMIKLFPTIVMETLIVSFER